MAKHRKKTNKNVPAKGRLRDMADGLWSIAVRDDWGNRCAVCGKSKCEAHHLIPRENESTHYELCNGIALCPSHHKFDPKISPHCNAAGWLLWLSENHPLRHEWYTETVGNGNHLTFDGIKNAQHYMGIIHQLKEYVNTDDFTRVVGIRFSKYLEEIYMINS